jgi:hypothetical protein
LSSLWSLLLLCLTEVRSRKSLGSLITERATSPLPDAPVAATTPRYRSSRHAVPIRPSGSGPRSVRRRSRADQWGETTAHSAPVCAREFQARPHQTVICFLFLDRDHEVREALPERQHDALHALLAALAMLVHHMDNAPSFGNPLRCSQRQQCCTRLGKQSGALCMLCVLPAKRGITRVGELGSNQRPLPCKGSTIGCQRFPELAEFLQI